MKAAKIQVWGQNMGHYIEKLKGKKIVCMEVVEKKMPYTRVYFEDGSSVLTSYAISETIRRLEADVVKINMGQAVNKEFVSDLTGNILTIKNMKMTVSRRKLALFLSLLLCVFRISAQTATNDTLKVCNDSAVKFSVFGNDLPTGKIQLAEFTQPATGELVSLSNTGGFRYYWNNGDTTAIFQYKIKLINTTTESSFATVRLSGKPKVVLSGNYPNTTLTTIKGCNISTNGSTTFISGAKYKLEHYQFTELKPGTVIDATGGGSVLIQAEK